MESRDDEPIRPRWQRITENVMHGHVHRKLGRVAGLQPFDQQNGWAYVGRACPVGSPNELGIRVAVDEQAHRRIHRTGAYSPYAYVSCELTRVDNSTICAGAFPCWTGLKVSGSW